MNISENNKKIENFFFSWGFGIFDKWLQIKNRRNSLSTYFEDNYLYRVAIYGLGAIGRRLYEELQKTETIVCYGIDQNASAIQIDGLEILTLEDKLTEVDAVVVTPVAFYEIEKNILQKMGNEVNIVSIEDVVDYCFSLA